MTSGIDYARIRDFVQSEYCEPINRKYRLSVCEPDEFSGGACYLAALAHGNVVGAVRLISTINQVNKYFDISDGPDFCELSRLIVSRSHRNRGSIMMSLFSQAHAMALKMGHSKMIAICNVKLMRLVHVLGYKSLVITSGCTFYGQKSCIVQWPIADAINYYNTRYKFRASANTEFISIASCSVSS